MQRFDILNIENLYSLYKKIGVGYQHSKLIQSDDYYIVKTDDSSWPNLAFLKDITQANEEIIEAISSTMKNLEMKPMVLGGPAAQPLNVFRKKGYMPVEQTVAMHLDLAGYEAGIESFQDVTIIKDAADIPEWTTLVSKELFDSKPLPPELFEFLQSDGSDLVQIKEDNKIVGTSLIYYDEAGNAGLYMVAVDQQFRQKGLGKKLMKFCIERVKEKKLEFCYLQSTKIGAFLYSSMNFEKGGSHILYWKVK